LLFCVTLAGNVVFVVFLPDTVELLFWVTLAGNVVFVVFLPEAVELPTIVIFTKVEFLDSSV
jgi:uncharacterized membrane protein